MDSREFLAFERNSPERHEFIDGEIVAMSGGTLAHSVIGANLGAELRAALRERPCLVASSDLRVKVEAGEFFTYPDVTVVCGDPLLDDEFRDTLLNPTAIFEVLSDSTERIDRHEKLLAYQTLPSLQEYVLVAQSARRVEVYRRANDWKAEYFDSGEIRLDCLERSVSVDAIYADVESFEVPAPDSIT